MIKIKEKFILNKSGRKKAVVLSYRDYEHLKEDLHDLSIIAERKSEPTISHAQMMHRLKRNGLL